MHTILCHDYAQLCQVAADILSAQILSHPQSVLGLATGSTPIGMYQQLVKRHQEGRLDFSQITTLNLDEYKGLPSNHPQSYRYFMAEHLFDHVNIPQENIHLPHGLGVEDSEECTRYDNLLQQHPVDIQVLGIGHNGHIGFNEPGDSFPKGTHCVRLAPSTIAANRRFFQCEEDVPQFAYTMGIGSIFQAKTILLLATGTAKAEILAKALEGAITPQVPASILQLHPHVIVVADQEAGSLLQHTTNS